ncbi:MAG: FG-GAP-like repeat-containing protein, partial [Bacteroidota bacterium]
MRYIRYISLDGFDGISNFPVQYTNYGFHEQNFSLLPGKSYDLGITPDNQFSNMYFHAWIDYNGDGDFSDSGEKIGSFMATGTNEGNIYFTVPQNTQYRASRLRITGAYQKPSLGPCEKYDYGETEDYIVTFSPFDGALDKPGVGGKVLPADFNNDGLEDFLVCAVESWVWGEYRIRAYQNNGNGTFTEVFNLARGLYQAEVVPCDFDSDNDIDFVLTGKSTYYDVNNTYETSYLFQNDGDFNFTQVQIDFFNDFDIAVFRWGDYDSDGDADLFILSDYVDTRAAKLYHNDRGIFTESQLEFEGIRGGDARWGDYNNDGYPDLVANGEGVGGSRVIRIYKNERSRFSFIDIDQSGTDPPGFDWGDFEGDGDLDLLCTGEELLVYRNEGNDQFVKMVAATDSVQRAKWGDYDSDGDMDVLACAYNSLLAIYENTGGGGFHRHELSYTFPSKSNYLSLGNADWIDHDQDGDLDVLVSDPEITTRLFENTNPTHVNNPPSRPVNIRAEQVGDQVILKWDPSNDDITRNEAIHYNVRFGSYSNSGFILAPMAGAYSGTPFIRKEGNASRKTEKILHNVNEGEYYWGVQAIDNSGLASEFSYTGGHIIVQPFFSKTISLSSFTSYDLVKWGDFNNDGSLDAFADGKVYRNNGVSFTLVADLALSAGLEDVICAEWIDYNNDGNLDISFSGSFETNVYAGMRESLFLVFTSSGGSFTEAVRRSDWVPGISGGFCWGDFNSDGMPDLLFSGETAIGFEDIYHDTRFFLNTRDQGLVAYDIPVNRGDLGTFYAEDLDADMDMDLIYTSRQEGLITLINDGDANFRIEGRGIGEFEGRYLFGDYDNDRDVDILVAGNTILRNTNNAFTSTGVELPDLSGISINWLDTDGDHDLDVLMGGADSVFKIINFRNEGNEFYLKNEARLLANTTGSITPWDVDGDHDLDLLFTGNLEGTNSYSVYRNNYNFSCEPPGPPQALHAEVDSNFDVILSWDDPVNEDGAKPGYFFDVKVGTSPGAVDVIAPKSDPQSGFLRTPHLGNASVNRQFRIADLPLGTYYWSVLAINQSQQTSQWAPMGSIRVTRVSPGFRADTVCHGFETRFTNQTVTKSTVNQWEWNFGDGTSSSEQDPGHIFSEGGYHNVTLTAYTISGDYASVTRKIWVKESPKARFSADPVCDRTEMQFTDQTESGGLAGLQYNWNFGDGVISSNNSSVSHLYSSPGNYFSSLTVFAANGCQNYLSREVTVAESPDAGIQFAQGHYSAFCNGDSTILEVPGGVGYSFQWQFNGADLIGETDSELIVYGPTG